MGKCDTVIVPRYDYYNNFRAFHPTHVVMTNSNFFLHINLHFLRVVFSHSGALFVCVMLGFDMGSMDYMSNFAGISFASLAFLYEACPFTVNQKNSFLVAYVHVTDIVAIVSACRFLLFTTPSSPCRCSVSLHVDIPDKS